jgi:signal transduction histidine kinase
MLLLIVLPMIVVLVFLVRGVQDFFTTQFYTQMESAFTRSELLNELRIAAAGDDAVLRMEEILVLFGGQLGIDRNTRNFYILSKGDDIGAVVATSNPDPGAGIDITPNIMSAMLGDDSYSGSSRTAYMDVAVSISDGKGGGYVVYIIDNKQTVQRLNAEIYTLILETVLIGFAISIATSLFISGTLLSPIKGMTKAAEAMADGDFSSKIRVESEDEIGILSKTFNDMATQIETMLEELKKAEKLRREFVANVSHELRTPLTSIRSYAETISDNRGIPNETEEEFLRVIINESDRMTKIVQDLLELSRFDSGTGKLSVEEFSIEQSVRDVYAAIALDAHKRGHDLNLEMEWKLPTIRGDRARIEQVLMNVISNAMKYTPDGGRIEIVTYSSGGNVIITIEDTGVGIPAEDLPRVFDRFYRVDKARSRESGGTGLGLSIAKEIITLHGGDIEISSTQGVGTKVTITLPITGVIGGDGDE